LKARQITESKNNEQAKRKVLDQLLLSDINILPTPFADDDCNSPISAVMHVDETENNASYMGIDTRATFHVDAMDIDAANGHVEDPATLFDGDDAINPTNPGSSAKSRGKRRAESATLESFAVGPAVHDPEIALVEEQPSCAI
jgi:hypothetical protein